MSEIPGTPFERERDAQAVDDALLDAFYGKPSEPAMPDLRPFYEHPVVSFREFKAKEIPMATDDQKQRRLVRVFVLDPDSRLEAKYALVYATCATPNPKDSTLTANEYNADIASGELIVTDLTDDQLLIGLLGLQEAIVRHCDLRHTMPDCEATRMHGRFVPLGPVTIADLEIRVVTVASVPLRGK